MWSSNGVVVDCVFGGWCIVDVLCVGMCVLSFASLFAWYGVFYVFFFKQKTPYEIRIRDWSSDVCSSDLFRVALADHHQVARLAVHADRVDVDHAHGLVQRERRVRDVVLRAEQARFLQRDRDERQRTLRRRRGARELAGDLDDRSEESRVGKGGVRTGGTWWVREN